MNLDAERSLPGIKVVVTRSREQNPALQELLESRGAEVVSLPTLRFVAVSPTDTLRELLLAHRNYTHVVFTSQVAVKFFAKLCRDQGMPPDRWRHATMAAVGAATAAALENHGWTSSYTAEGGSSEALARELFSRGHLDSDHHVLIPQSAIARPEIEEVLTNAGIQVTAVSIYEPTTEAPECAASFLSFVKSGVPPDAILFASPSAVKAFLELTGAPGEQFLERPETLVVSIGPTTSRTIRKRGYEVSAQAERPAIDGLVTALEAAVRNRPPSV